VTIPPTGWYVEIDDPETGHTWTPDVVGSPEINPGANAFPKVSIPVRKRDRWLDSRYEGAPMRVWKDGQRQPIDQFEEPVESEEQFSLNGRGGVSLDTRVQLEVEQRGAHLVAQDLIQNKTSYTANIDEPDAAAQDNVVFQSPDTQSEWTSVVSIPDTTPATINTGTLQLEYSSFFAEAEDITNTGIEVSDSEASAGKAQKLSIGDATLSANTQYTIPASNAQVAMRYRIPSNTTSPSFDLVIDGEAVVSASENALSDTSYSWFTTNAGLSSDLPAGEHPAGIEVGSSGEDIIVDAIVLFDDRYSYTFDNSVDSNGYLSGPEPYPGRAEVQTADAATAFQFTGARLDASYDDTSNQQRVGISNDQGATWIYADNAEVVEADYASGAPEIRGKLGLSRYGTRSTASPTSGINGQTVDLYELAGDISETPLLINQDYDDKLINVLQDIADSGDFIFEYRKSGGTPSVEMTKPGQRTATSTPSPTAYQYSKTVEQQAKRVIVKGGRQRQREEEFTADHGAAVQLANGNIDRGTEAVYDLSTGEAYIEGEDYRLSPGIETDRGAITTLSGGSMTDGDTYGIDYNYHEQGVATSASAGADPKPLVRTIPGITTQRACNQAATILLRQLEEPLEEAQVTLPTSKVGFNIVDAQEFAALPTDTSWEIREITTKPGQTQFRLGTRQSVDEIVGRIQRRLSAASKRT